MTYEEALKWAMDHGVATRFYEGKVRMGAPVGDEAIVRIEPINHDEPIEQMRSMIDSMAEEFDAKTQVRTRHLVAV